MYNYFLLFVFLFFLKNVKCCENYWDWEFKNWNNYNSTNWINKWNISNFTYGEENLSFINNPTNKSELMIKIKYPKGSYKPSNENNVGGIGFYTKFKQNNIEHAIFEYQIYFQKKFLWKKGGKLPGLYGGITGCSGGIDAEDNNCFSTRYMWRKNGEGELYAYLPKNQKNNFCEDILGKCENDEYGFSIKRGSFKFKSGKWNKLKQEIKLNKNSYDGTIKCYINDKIIIDEKNVNFRQNKSVQISGIDFETFFGGGSKDYATPKDQYVLFKDFKFKFL